MTPALSRALIEAEQRARATRPDLWPTWAAPPALPEPEPLAEPTLSAVALLGAW